MAEIEQHQGNKRTKTHHRSTRVDLTPMVDLGFLLITFFVFTTSMSEPKAMLVLEPIAGDSSRIKGSGALTIIVSKEQDVYYYIDQLNPLNPDQIKKISFNDIRNVIINMKRNTKKSDLMFILKADQEASFGNMVNLFDEMAICGITQGHYSESEMTNEEMELIGMMR